MDPRADLSALVPSEAPPPIGCAVAKGAGLLSNCQSSVLDAVLSFDRRNSLSGPRGARKSLLHLLSSGPSNFIPAIDHRFRDIWSSLHFIYI